MTQTNLKRPASLVQGVPPAGDLQPSRWKSAWGWFTQHLLARLIMGALVFLGGYWIRNDLSKRLLLVEVRLQSIEKHLNVKENGTRLVKVSTHAPRKNLPRP